MTKLCPSCCLSIVNPRWDGGGNFCTNCDSCIPNYICCKVNFTPFVTYPDEWVCCQPTPEVCCDTLNFTLAAEYNGNIGLPGWFGSVSCGEFISAPVTPQVGIDVRVTYHSGQCYTIVYPNGTPYFGELGAILVDGIPTFRDGSPSPEYLLFPGILGYLPNISEWSLTSNPADYTAIAFTITDAMGNTYDCVIDTQASSTSNPMMEWKCAPCNCTFCLPNTFCACIDISYPPVLDNVGVPDFSRVEPTQCIELSCNSTQTTWPLLFDDPNQDPGTDYQMIWHSETYGLPDQTYKTEIYVPPASMNLFCVLVVRVTGTNVAMRVANSTGGYDEYPYWEGLIYLEYQIRDCCVDQVTGAPTCGDPTPPVDQFRCSPSADSDGQNANVMGVGEPRKYHCMVYAMPMIDFSMNVTGYYTLMGTTYFGTIARSRVTQKICDNLCRPRSLCKDCSCYDATTVTMTFGNGESFVLTSGGAPTWTSDPVFCTLINTTVEFSLDCVVTTVDGYPAIVYTLRTQCITPPCTWTYTTVIGTFATTTQGIGGFNTRCYPINPFYLQQDNVNIGDLNDVGPVVTTTVTVTE